MDCVEFSGFSHVVQAYHIHLGWSTMESVLAEDRQLVEVFLVALREGDPIPGSEKVKEARRIRKEMRTGVQPSFIESYGLEGDHDIKKHLLKLGKSIVCSKVRTSMTPNELIGVALVALDLENDAKFAEDVFGGKIDIDDLPEHEDREQVTFMVRLIAHVEKQGLDCSCLRAPNIAQDE